MDEDIKMLTGFYSDGIVKKEINQLLWGYLHPKTHIDEAEKLAATIHEEIEELFEQVKKRQPTPVVKTF